LRALAGESLRDGTREHRSWGHTATNCIASTRVRDALLHLRAPSFHLRPCEVHVPIVHGFELAAINGYARFRKEAHLTAEFDETRNLAQRQDIVFAEVRDLLVMRSNPSQQPHDLDIATGLSFEPTTRLYPVQIAVAVQL
jgi:hypothetical protein